MNKLGGGGLIVTGLVILAIGWLIGSDLVRWLISAVSFLFMLAGAGVAIVGVIKLFTGKKSGSSEY